MRKIIIFLIVLTLFNIASINTIFAESPSDWAINEIEELKSSGYFSDNRFNDYQKPITRVEFVYFASRLFEIMNGQEIKVENNINYSDTTDIWALKGTAVNITTGVGNGQFAPDKILTREEFATMIVRTMQLGEISMSSPSNFMFSDDKDISSWAKEAMYLAKENNILNGIGNNLSAPKQEATVEQCIALINRILKNNKGKEFTYNDKTNIIPYDYKPQNISVIKYGIGEYTGEIKNSMPNGFGTMVYSNEDIYEGEWQDGLRHGTGTLTCYNEDGYVDSKYIGNWENNKKNGIGSFESGDSKYSGEWKNDKKNGIGTFENTDYQYTGDWQDGYMQGQGEYITKPRNEIYEHYLGEMYENRYSGVGNLKTYRNGDLYKIENGFFVIGLFQGENINVSLPKDITISDRTIGDNLGRYYGESSSFFDLWSTGGYGIIFLQDGSEYLGQWKDGMYDGYGKLTKADGSILEGKWSMGRFEYPIRIKNGNTISVFGGTYTGELKGIIPHGYGVFNYQNGEIYEGEFEYGYKSGEGKHTWPGGDSYYGQWKKDKFNGYGSSNMYGNKIVGEWKNDRPHGDIKLERENGEIYEGEWENNQPHGKGTYTWPNGQTYIGEFKKGEYNGFGRLKMPDGHTYEGEFQNHQKHGKGIYTWPSGQTYIGDFENDEYNGFGILKKPDGQTYEGEWVNGIRHGIGNIIFSNGQTYEGEWENNQPHGKGTYTWPSGDTYEGEWANGIQHGTGKHISPDGKIYQGEWANGKPNGYGKLIMADGKINEGLWEDGHFLRE